MNKAHNLGNTSPVKKNLPQIFRLLNIKKISIYSLIMSFALLLTDSQSKFSNANTVSLDICPGFKAQKIYAVPTINQKKSCPGENSQIIYVSASGNNDNNGLSINSPVKSLSRARQLIRTNSPDWIVLKRGDTFNDGLGVVKPRRGNKFLGGKSAERPLVITSYGESLKRPVIKAKHHGIDLWGSFNNVTISGLEFYSKPGTGGTGIRTLNEGRNYVIHNNYISGFANGINLQAKQKEGKRFSHVLVKDNIITNSASQGKGHSQGIFAKSVNKLRIEGNVIDSCGWHLDRNGQLPNSRIATKFNHCLYLQNGGYPATIKNNIVTRASSHGLQARSGAFVVNNLFARNPIQFFVSSKGLDGKGNQTRMIAKNNVILEGNDINLHMPRGTGIQHNNAYFALYENNIIAHVLSPSKSNKRAIDIVCKTDDVHTSITGQCKARFINNFVFDWGNDFGGNLIMGRDFKHNLEIRHQIKGNHFVVTNSRAKFVNFKAETLKNKYVFYNNIYSTYNIQNQNLFSLPGKAQVSFEKWKNAVEKTAKSQNSVEFPDACRTMATYYDDFILNNTKNDNCKIMHNNKLFEQFMDLAKQKNSMIEGSGVEVNSVMNYVRQGFDRKP